MEVFVVTREGVYRHDVLGVFQDILSAEKRAYEVASLEDEDGYHFYQVSSCPINQPIEDLLPKTGFQKTFEMDRSVTPYKKINPSVKVIKYDQEREEWI